MISLDSLVCMENVENEKDFIALVAAALQAFAMTHLELAELLDVAQSTVTRWVRGTNLPHRLMRQAIKERVMQEAKRRISLRSPQL